MPSANTVAAVATMLLAFVTLAPGQETKIKRSDLPPAVERAVVKEGEGATIRGFSQERENGQTFYEAELIVDGHSKDVLMDVDGVVVEVEEQVGTELLSPAVLAGLQVKAGEGKLVKVETLTKKGKLVAYEAQILTNGRKSEVQVRPDGKKLVFRGVTLRMGDKGCSSIRVLSEPIGRDAACASQFLALQFPRAF
jgi:hypothetical protein